jgi:threonine dehydrogenase-like Zn-dependent dehydrogenase
MKAVIRTKQGLDMIDVPEPQIIHPDDVKIRVAYSSVCGSDLHIYRGELDDIFGKDMIRMGEVTI